MLEYLEGTSLADEVHYKGAMDVGRAAYVGTQIASALVAAHARGIIHRDLKPDNIFLTIRDEKKDHVKILDFGISKIESRAEAGKYAGLVVGTPDYMAPEQVTAPATVDARADIFAVGACLYEALSGRAPLDAGESEDALDAVVRRTPAPLLRIKPNLPQGLVHVIEKAMTKDRAKRYQTMAELRAALEPFASSPEAAPPVSLRSPKISGIQTLGNSSSAPPSSPSSERISVSNAMAPPPPASVPAITGEVAVPSAPESARSITAPVIETVEKADVAPTTNTPATTARTETKKSKAPIVIAALVGAAAVAAGGWFFAHHSAGATAAATTAEVHATPATETNGNGVAAVAAADAPKAAEQQPAPTAAAEEPKPAPAPPPVAENTPPPAAAQAAAAPAAPAAIPGAGGVVSFGEGMTRPSPLAPGEIQYTREAREANVQGVMIVRCTVATTGQTQNCRVIKGLPFMDQAVLSAFASHRGTPVTYQGKPVAAEYTFTIHLKGN